MSETTTSAFSTRLISLRKATKLSQAELAQKVNTSRQTIVRWEGGETSPDVETINALASVFNTSIAYLMGETDDPAPSQLSRVGTPGLELQSNARPIQPENILMVPMVSPEIRASAGNGNSYGVDVPELEVVGVWPLYDPKLSAFYSSESLSCMTVEGDSMEPQIHDGDIVVFNHDPSWVSGNIMVVCLDGRLMVKGVVANGQGRPPILRSLNPDYKDIKITEESFFLVYGRVLKINTERAPKPIL